MTILTRNVALKGARLAVFVTATFTCAGSLSSPARASYLEEAQKQTEWIQKNFFDESAGLYRASVPVDPKALPYEFMWGNGVQMSVLAAAVRHDRAKYEPILARFTKGLEKHWDADAPVPGYDAYFASRDGDDKYYDDNAWLTLAFAEAHTNTKDPKYLEWARRTHRFVLSSWDQKLDGGLYWHQQKLESKNTCTNAPTATGALALAALGEPGQVQWAQRIVSWTRSKLQDRDGLYWDNIKLDGTIQKHKWTYNTALMIRANLGLWRAQRDPKYLQEARRESDSAIKEWANSETGGFANDARFNHLLSEALIGTYEATRDIKYLNAVRRDADFGLRHVRDPRGGWWNKWTKIHAPDEPKILIENASAARLMWLLAPYPDARELSTQATAHANANRWKQAIDLYAQAVASTS